GTPLCPSRAEAPGGRGSGCRVAPPCWYISIRRMTSAALIRSMQRAIRSSGVSCTRSEEHTSELQSLTNLVCRLLLEKKNTHHARISWTGDICAYREINSAPPPIQRYRSLPHQMGQHQTERRGRGVSSGAL